MIWIGRMVTMRRLRLPMPAAIFQEGSQSIRHITPSDNRGAGASIGNQLRGTPDGVKVRIKVDP